MKEKIEKLKITGGVYIWKYTDNDRNYPGWNITVDNLASKELSVLFDLMEHCEWSTSKKIQTTKPTESELSVLSNRNGTGSWTTRPNVSFSLKTNRNPDHWTTNEKSDELEISFGKEKLKELWDAIINIPKGKGDFAIGDKDEENILYFWWRLGT